MRSPSRGNPTTSLASSSQSPGPPEPQEPSHKPTLPSLPTVLHDDGEENVLQPNADPLSVLAFAGRLVGRETTRQSARQSGDRKEPMKE